MEFAEAMNLKLRLNREGQGLVTTDPLANPNAQFGQTNADSLRASIIQWAKARHSHLTDETALRMLEEFGC